MSNKRVHEIAKERGLPAKDVLARLKEAGIDVKASSSSVDEEVASRVLANGGQALPASGSDAAVTKAKPAAQKAKAKGADGAKPPAKSAERPQGQAAAKPAKAAPAARAAAPAPAAESAAPGAGAG